MRGEALQLQARADHDVWDRLPAITCPTLAIAFQHDNIVPIDSAEPLVAQVSTPDNELWKLPGGHVGAVVSRSAAKGLWPKLSAWWAVRD